MGNKRLSLMHIYCDTCIKIMNKDSSMPIYIANIHDQHLNDIICI